MMSWIVMLIYQLIAQYDCSLIITKCSLCNTVIENNLLIIPLPNLDIVWKYNFANLETELNDYVSNKMFTCNNCNIISASCQYELGPYLWIDTDDAYTDSTFAKEKGIEKEKLFSNLNDIPQKLVIKDQTYLLCGAVKYVPPLMSNKIGHYIAFCKQLNSTWKERNDLVKCCKIHGTKVQILTKLSAILYVKCNV